MTFSGVQQKASQIEDTDFWLPKSRSFGRRDQIKIYPEFGKSGLSQQTSLPLSELKSFTNENIVQMLKSDVILCYTWF